MGIFSIFKKSVRAAKRQAVKVSYNAGLALSGGGARGMGHIGVLKAFEEQGIQFSCVAGTSAGSLVGALYAAGYTADDIAEFAKSIKERDIVNSRILFIPSKSINVENTIRRFIGDMKFDQLKLPFAAVAVDLKNGDEVVLKEGLVAKAVSASSAVPGVFTPVEWGEYRLVDGGLLNTIPSDTARKMGAEHVIAVDLNSTRGQGTTSTKTLDILKATFRITMKNSALKGYQNADIVIAPDLTKFKSTKLDGADQMIENGYMAAMEKMDEIKELLKIKEKYAVVNVKHVEKTKDTPAPFAVEEPKAEAYTQEWFDKVKPR